VQRVCVCVWVGVCSSMMDRLLSHNHKSIDCILYPYFLQALISHLTSELPLLSGCVDPWRGRKYPGPPTSVVEYRTEVAGIEDLT
jgi:hypothetical protein